MAWNLVELFLIFLIFLKAPINLFIGPYARYGALTKGPGLLPVGLWCCMTAKN